LASNGNSRRSGKPEIRNPNFETKSNDQKRTKFEANWIQLSFGNLDLSIFDLFRISSFGFRILIPWSLLEAIYFLNSFCFKFNDEELYG